MAKDQLKPRLCHMLKGEQGYGFHLHGEKGKSGQFIRKVEPGSPAEAAALRAGDRVVEVNGVNVDKETHHQVRPRPPAPCLLSDIPQDALPTEWSQPVGVAPESPTTAAPADVNGQMKESRPRLCHLKKGPNGYGFNLHSEKSRPGQFIRSVDPDSPASKAGLRPQDKLIEVNGINVEGMKHSEVVSHIKSKENEAKLLVVDPEMDDYFKKLGVTPTEEHIKGECETPTAKGNFQTGPTPSVASKNNDQDSGASSRPLPGTRLPVAKRWMPTGVAGAVAAQGKVSRHPQAGSASVQTSYCRSLPLHRCPWLHEAVESQAPKPSPQAKTFRLL
uniref:NHERF family PDZ scaffold protein 2 n=1 Tax=Crocodylus porosus TaxID=8502 RepID=A0A7M4F8F5_CROPO